MLRLKKLKTTLKLIIRT